MPTHKHAMMTPVSEPIQKMITNKILLSIFKMMTNISFPNKTKIIKTKIIKTKILQTKIKKISFYNNKISTNFF